MTLHTSAPADRRAAWEADSELLDVFRDKPTDIIAFVEHCSGADLHGFDMIHGVPAEVEIYRAILTHPECDRSTALNIFEACDPHFYEQQFAKGRTTADMAEPDDQTMIAILDLAHAELCKRPGWRARFACSALAIWQELPERSPVGFSRWPLPAACLTEPEGQILQPMVTYSFSTIRLTYQAWALRQ